MNTKINEVLFYGFTNKELERIRKEIGKTGEDEFNMAFTQEVSDLLGFDVLTIIQPGGRVDLMKAGE